MLTYLCCNYVYRRKGRNSMRKNFKHWRLVTLLFSIIHRRADVRYYFIFLIKHDCCCWLLLESGFYRIEGRIYSRVPPLKWTSLGPPLCGGICISEASGIVLLGVVMCTQASEHTRPHFGTFLLPYMIEKS